MRNTRLSVLAGSLLLLTAAAGAEDAGMRAGLWEMTTSSQLLKLAEHIPPDQMQQLRNLARQYGLDMPEIRNGAATSQVCITQEMADRKTPPDFSHNQSGCNSKNATRTGNRYTADLVCDGPTFQGKGKAEGTFTSAESFTGRTVFQGLVQGNPVNEQADVSGRWISANCGAVKPPQ